MINFRKGLTKMKEKTISTIKSILNDDKSKLTLGLSLIGVGGALVLSIYIKVPQQ